MRSSTTQSVQTVIGTLALAYPGGTESYCITIAHELDRLGHDVTLFADELGPLAERLSAEGMDVVGSADGLPARCDAVIANDAITAGVLAERYPQTRLVYCLHNVLLDAQLPPLEPGVIAAIVAPSERFAAYARALAIDVPVVRLAQPIDIERFAPTQPPGVTPRRALLLSHYLEGRRRAALVDAWTAAGIECVQVGVRDEVAFDAAEEIAEADIVVGKGRAALEGMACGKAVYVFDTWGGDGWVTADSYAAFEADNFAGLTTERPVGPADLAADLDRYDPDMGWINRELVVTHHLSRAHVHGLVEILRGAEPRARDSVTSSAATARTVRSAWRAQRRAMSLEGQVADLRTQVRELERDRRAAWQATRVAERASRDASSRTSAALEAADAITADRDAWRERAFEAERQTQAARNLLGTRRVRAGLAVGRSLDRVLGRR